MSILQANNTTPEGLCYEAILKQLVPSTNESQSYFLNFSDGQPSYSISRGSDEMHYSGEPAAIHTKQQVKKIRESGIDVLSYFITDYGTNFEHSSDWRVFKQMYGNDAKYVNVENMFEVAKTMNELFLSKNKK
jgi:nitric oxide reductase activation protein